MGEFEVLCELLPAEVNWGDPITPQMVEEIILAERQKWVRQARRVRNFSAPDDVFEAVPLRVMGEERPPGQYTIGERPRFSAGHIF